MKTLRAEELKPGMIVADTPTFSMMTTVMEFVDFTKEKVIFKYLGGYNCYYRDDDGLICFGVLEKWYVLNKKEIKEWTKGCKTGTGNAAEE